MTHHVHNKDCPGHCSREVDVDPRTTTGTYRIVARKGYGSRPKHDKPWWFPFVFHAYRSIIQLLGLVGLAWLMRKLGLAVVP